MPRDPFNPPYENETFCHRDFWRRFERSVIQELSRAHSTGERGIRYAGNADTSKVQQPDFNVPNTAIADTLRDTSVQTGSRWAAWLTDAKMYLVHGDTVELESVLLDGIWFHTWNRR